MHAMTRSNLQSAFAGESQAHMRYPIYADKADRDGLPNVARLFRAITFGEQIHATSHFQVMRNEVGAAQTVAGAINVCSQCGHTLVGKAPDRCPICNAQKERFRAFA